MTLLRLTSLGANWICPSPISRIATTGNGTSRNTLRNIPKRSVCWATLGRNNEVASLISERVRFTFVNVLEIILTYYEAKEKQENSEQLQIIKQALLDENDKIKKFKDALKERLIIYQERIHFLQVEKTTRHETKSRSRSLEGHGVLVGTGRPTKLQGYAGVHSKPRRSVSDGCFPAMESIWFL